MLNQFSRTQLIYGKSSIEKLQKCHVAIFGIGGVGGYVADALARSGVGEIDLIDDDKVCMTNINRQLIATFKTIGQYKVDVMEEHLKEINPKIKINKFKCFYLPSNANEFDFTKYDYVIDAIDTVTAKIDIICKCKELNIPIISAMGAGNKINPAALEISDIYKTTYDPLCKVMRRELKKRHIKKLKVVYSKEKALRPIEDMAISCRSHCVCPPGTVRKCTERRDIPGSSAFVPSTMGLIIASEVVKDLTQEEFKKEREEIDNK